MQAPHRPRDDDVLLTPQSDCIGDDASLASPCLFGLVVVEFPWLYSFFRLLLCSRAYWQSCVCLTSRFLRLWKATAMM